MPDFEELRARLAERIEVSELVQLLMLRIQGVEVTQGIQFYRADQHLSDANDRGPDNSLRLVAAKPAWVRVYLRSLLTMLPGVTGTLKVYRRVGGVFWNEVATINPQAPGTADAVSFVDYATQRADLDSTLNFIIPSSDMCGKLKLVITVTKDSHSATREVVIDATLRQTLSMRIVPVAYNGTDAGGAPLTLPAPTLAVAQATAAWANTVYPVDSSPNITLTAAVNLTFPLTGSPASPGGCAASWLNLNTLVAQARTADGNQPNTFYYGLVPQGVPLGANSGCASSGVTSGMANGAITMAHEFGHAMGFPHAPCGGVGASADATYPAYEPYDPAGTPGGSIGEYGLDINNGNIKDPATFRDFMGYCNPDWISIYNHQRSIQNALLNPRFTCQDEPWWHDWVAYDPWWWLHHSPYELPDQVNPPIEAIDTTVDVVSVILAVELGGKLDVRSMTRTRAATAIHGARGTSLIAELLDADGDRLSAARVMRLQSFGGGCGGSSCGCEPDRDDDPGLLQVLIPLPQGQEAQSLRIVNVESEVLRVERTKRAVRAPKLSAKVGRRGLDIAWELRKNEQDLEVWIRCHKKGEPPRVVYIAKGSGKVRLDPSHLPCGRVSFDAVVHTGFEVISGRALSCDLPTRPPVATVLHPKSGQTFLEGRALRLHGLATDSDGEHADPKECRWLLEGKEVARGPDAWLAAPEAGEYRLVFEASGAGRRAKETVEFRTVSRKPR